MRLFVTVNEIACYLKEIACYISWDWLLPSTRLLVTFN